MPMSAAPGDRERIERALGPVFRLALRRACATLGVPAERWQRVPALARPFTTIAVVRRAADFTEGDTAADRGENALRRAAEELDLAPTTIRTRLYRWGYDAETPNGGGER